MSKELMELVLPRMAQRLDRQLRRYRAGELDDDQFTRKFETLLQQQYSWLSGKGVSEIEAAVTIHGAVLVLSSPGLKAEALEQDLPLEVIEFQAACSAAEDIAENYGVNPRKALRRICTIIAEYSD